MRTRYTLAAISVAAIAATTGGVVSSGDRANPSPWPDWKDYCVGEDICDELIAACEDEYGYPIDAENPDGTTTVHCIH